MPTYPVTIRRCQHIKVNGIQCGSPAKRNEMHCFFHEQCHLMGRQINMKFTENGVIKLPTLEDANSIQLGLSEVMRMVVTRQIDHRIASLLLRALRIAADNVKFTSLEPKPTRIVIDPKCVEHRPLGASAWSAVEGQEYDLEENPNEDQKNEMQREVQREAERKDAQKKAAKPIGPRTPEDFAFDRDYWRLVEGVARDPNFLDRPWRPDPTPEPPQSSAPLAEPTTDDRESATENREPSTKHQAPTTESRVTTTENHP
jgi:hypothetical protein